MTTEAEYRAWVENYIASQTKDEDLSKYTYSCTTQCNEFGDDYSGLVNKDYFYVPTAENETILTYEFSYTTTVGGYNTDDEIRVLIFHSEEDIAPKYGVFSISFNRHRFDKLSSVNISSDKVKRTVKDLLKRTYRQYGQIVKSFNIENSALIFKNGKLCLLCLVEVDSKKYATIECVTIEIP